MTWGKLVESVPNISEGRRRSVVEHVAAAAKGSGRKVIDISSDPDHNRSVITVVGQPEKLADGIFNLAKAAVETIDLRGHSGAHPRMGAVDVIPFVPIRGVAMSDCISLSEEVGSRIAEQLGVPVYLYEESARLNERRNLAAVREGEFEGLTMKLADPDWKPDFGELHPHPSAGAVAVGAREFLIAYNINLDTADLKVAKEIARITRFSSGGLPYVKALGLSLEEKGITQVSMNLTNFKKTPILQVFNVVQREAARRGVSVIESEIVGKIPRQALYDVAASTLSVEDPLSGMVLEDEIEKAIAEDW